MNEYLYQNSWSRTPRRRQGILGEERVGRMTRVPGHRSRWIFGAGAIFGRGLRLRCLARASTHPLPQEVGDIEAREW